MEISYLVILQDENNNDSLCLRIVCDFVGDSTRIANTHHNDQWTQ